MCRAHICILDGVTCAQLRLCGPDGAFMSINLELFPLSYMFMVAACLALVVNFPGLKEQQEQLALHAPPILAVSSLIFAAGVFTGVLSGTGMANAVATGLLQVIPDSLGPYMAVIT